LSPPKINRLERIERAAQRFLAADQIWMDAFDRWGGNPEDPEWARISLETADELFCAKRELRKAVV